MSEQRSERIQEIIDGPSWVQNADGAQAQPMDPVKVIAADQYLAQKAAARKRHRGLRLTQLVPPGAD